MEAQKINPNDLIKNQKPRLKIASRKTQNDAPLSFANIANNEPHITQQNLQTLKNKITEAKDKEKPKNSLFDLWW
jgi:hypothetical protein